ncbi:Isochorismatase-like protein [Apodospora peruviana]|uniref:Isochorismatase-like protein n=1 Tax=Apodospora peruviana TaxID=516989 RepID=A0AAE0M8E9_9PEZI|nr:Isochorismatase-like protein [Apodospora peruviana]
MRGKTAGCRVNYGYPNTERLRLPLAPASCHLGSRPFMKSGHVPRLSSTTLYVFSNSVTVFTMSSSGPQRRFGMSVFSDASQARLTDILAVKILENPAVFICDIQEKFRNAIFEFDKVVLTATKLLRASSTLAIPVFVTTQNSAKLGDTVAELQPYLTSSPSNLNNSKIIIADKTRFSMWIPPISSHIPSSPQIEAVIVGIESHICVTQTALDLLSAGHKVYILADGVSSCNREEVPIALTRLREAGAVVTTSESWIYECMGDAVIPEFKGIVSLVKDTSGDTKKALQGLLGPVSKI